ncbi:SusD/RagB family nutrient-binding outer membrane lipoprotein [Maribacter ulvicola]|uniref:Starch-binding associating with outer membrane n=1 Tax=Maribacter ulvicola TaxID=228959 RepID=A0A1N6QLM3_9FLAO|nr:SusD/RagB family nutrient-binding outer membrane lipoprotein [Maribacter ulvicola]SIQ17499.1 Starch-binding associating with outer membrane [Maribacter ulvicola]
MKKSIYILLFALLSVGACDDGFEELNVNPTKPNQVAASNKLTSVMKFISSERYDNWRAGMIYQSTMMQHVATTAGYWSGDKYTWNKGYASSLLDRYYENAIKTIVDLQVQLDEEEAPEEMKSIVRILRVFAFSRITDLYGDVPYSEAGKAVLDEIFLPKYDAQSEIYPDLLNELEEAAAALGTGTSGFGAADVIYNGDQTKWKKLANSLMLRLGLRLVKVDPTASQAWVTKAIAGGVMTSNEDIFYLTHDVNNKNGLGEVFTADSNPRMSDTFINLLQDNNDPRLTVLASLPAEKIIFKEDLPDNPGTYVEDFREDRTVAERLDFDSQRGLANGNDNEMLNDQNVDLDNLFSNLNDYSEPNRLLVTSETSPMIFQTYAEVEFMLAEANVRWGLAGDAATHYNNGVTAAMKQLSLYGDAGIISDSDITDYLTANPYDANNAIEQINTQYWVATFLNEYETFSNWRRTGFPVLTPVNYPGNVTNGTIPRRLTYSESEQSNNPDNYAAAIAAQGPDVLTTRVWWDVE